MSDLKQRIREALRAKRMAAKNQVAKKPSKKIKNKYKKEVAPVVVEAVVEEVEEVEAAPEVEERCHRSLVMSCNRLQILKSHTCFRIYCSSICTLFFYN